MLYDDGVYRRQTQHCNKKNIIELCIFRNILISKHDNTHVEYKNTIFPNITLVIYSTIILIYPITYVLSRPCVAGSINTTPINRHGKTDIQYNVMYYKYDIFIFVLKNSYLLFYIRRLSLRVDLLTWY